MFQFILKFLKSKPVAPTAPCPYKLETKSTGEWPFPTTTSKKPAKKAPAKKAPEKAVKKEPAKKASKPVVKAAAKSRAKSKKSD